MKINKCIHAQTHNISIIPSKTLQWCHSAFLSPADTFNKMQKSSRLNHKYSRLYNLFVFSVFFRICTPGEENKLSFFFFFKTKQLCIEFFTECYNANISPSGGPWKKSQFMSLPLLTVVCRIDVEQSNNVKKKTLREKKCAMVELCSWIYSHKHDVIFCVHLWCVSGFVVWESYLRIDYFPCRHLLVRSLIWLCHLS